MQHGRPELLAASDETIDDAIRYADPLALRGVLYQLTGDEELLDIELTHAGGRWFSGDAYGRRQGRCRPYPGEGRGVSQVIP